MRTKALEIRDRGTFIPVIATRMQPTHNWPAGTKAEEQQWERCAEAERYLLSRAGYGTLGNSPCVMVCRMDANGQVPAASYDVYGWNNPRTMPTAHQYIEEHFDELESGAVIDVEFLLGESKEPKLSERLI